MHVHHLAQGASLQGIYLLARKVNRPAPAQQTSRNNMIQVVHTLRQGHEPTRKLHAMVGSNLSSLFQPTRDHAPRGA